MSLPVWSTACPDWEQRIVEKRSLIPFEPLFPSEAEEALKVFKALKIVDVPGMPTFGEACREWVFDFVGAIFGAYNKETATRLIEEFFLCIAKKNGKSTIAAAIMITALIRNWRHSAELLILAPTLEVANNSFKPAADIVRADPALRDLLHVQDNYKTITHRITKASLKVVAADPNTVGGKKAAFILIDELWLFGKQANADSMLSEATGGRATRPEGFVIYLSTHSDAPPAGVFKDKLDLFRNIRDGKKVDNKKLGVLYEFPDSYLKNDSYLKPEYWYITNPNMGRSVNTGFIADRLDEANDEGKRRVALAKWLNVEIGMNLRGDRWPGAKYWANTTSPALAGLKGFAGLMKIIELSECVTLGADGGGLDDLFGFSAIGRLPGAITVEFELFGQKIKQKMHRWLTWSHAFCHIDVLENRQSIATQLLDFKANEELTIFNEKLIDIGSIIALVKVVKDAGKFGGFGVDPAGLGELTSGLEEIGIIDEATGLFGVPQGYGLMNTIKSVERHLAKGLLEHSGGLMMPWAVANLKIEPTATAIRATKQNAGDAKIDPVMAMFDAACVMLKDPKPIKPAQYQMFMIA